MVSIDLRDAYYSGPIDKEQEMFQFYWEGISWQFRTFPNGLTSGPWLFTKILKPALAYLRSIGINIVAYLDDTLIIVSKHFTMLQKLPDY